MKPSLIPKMEIPKIHPLMLHPLLSNFYGTEWFWQWHTRKNRASDHTSMSSASRTSFLLMPLTGAHIYFTLP